jgi:alpha-glucosidase (family GH31 glycosyl hydrolase)
MDDPLSFCTAEEYFGEASAWNGPLEIVSISQDPPLDTKEKDYWRGVNLKFDDGTLCVVQYVRPTLWRVRYDPTVTDANAYRDENGRTIVMDYMTELIEALDSYIGLTWRVTVEESEDKTYWTFSSMVIDSDPKAGRPNFYRSSDGMRLILYKKPFRIQALRTLTPLKELYPMPEKYGAAATMPKGKIIWQTSPRTFRHHIHSEHGMLKEVIIDVVKAGHGEFLGFGEQGGTSFMKMPCYMNYFNFDNMQYQQVYNQGPLDPREPLYHSDPFYFDVNSNPEHANVTATFLDNYSQISVDFGKTNSGYIKLGTRFGPMDCYLISANTVPEVVRLYTSIMGRPKLKPRYILGNHQACYGYEDDEAIHAVYTQYRESKIPLDGLHVDVDFQDGFRTFTIDPKFFGKSGQKFWPGPKEMFTELRENGIKCSTNITPVISINDRPGGYSTLNEGVEKGYLVKDDRYTKGTSGLPKDVRYVCYGGGNKYEVDPNDVGSRPDFGDHYDFGANFNSKNYPFHGGVSYGYGNGTAGFYPDLNRSEVRTWWGKQYQYLFDQGLEFVWQDMTTPAIHDSYGDMKGLPSRLLVNSDDVSQSSQEKKLAIEIWALYSYNLHKATANGLDNLHKLVPSRKGKRNFILGRGSFAGMYRYAGLWTGDNASTWDFWQITVSQVLSVGLNGVSIAGADAGGFEPKGDEKYCSPELIIRWYAGSFLLPWLRNHYVKKNRKWFQEPYAYRKHIESGNVPPSQIWLFEAVENICRYYVELRYSLIQLLYDAMFENIIDGLPIVRSMLLTDTQDTSFFNETQKFLDNQYVVRRDILVAPIMQSSNDNPGENRDVYLPLGYFWYPSNLRPWDDQGVALEPAVEGGSVINYTAKITNNYADFAYVTPVYVREGGIVPQIKVTQWIGDLSDGPNHIKFNVYPGRNNEYTTYLDDGISRSSSPNDLVYNQKSAKQEKENFTVSEAEAKEKYLDPEAKGEYRAVSISQTTSKDSTRTITITRIARDSDYDPVKELGDSYTIILWYNQGTNVDNYEVTVTGAMYESSKNSGLRTVVVLVKEIIGVSRSVTVKVVTR